jgi:hypothetical protein
MRSLAQDKLAGRDKRPIRLLLRQGVAVLAALAVFAMIVCAVVAATPYVLGRLYGCAPPVGCCGDSVGWAMIILSPLLVPLTLLSAAALSILTYFRIVQAKTVDLGRDEG